jgi:hypothetical protein
MYMSININIEGAVGLGGRLRSLDPEPLVVALYRRAWADGDESSTVSAVADVAASIGIERDRVRDGIDAPRQSEPAR